MREIDGRLSDRASHYWPRALVVRIDRDTPAELWLLERPDIEPVGLGRHYGEATRALGALIRAAKP